MTDQQPIEVGGAIHVDGAQGEGGGQVLRSSLALAMITGRPAIIERIRARRDKPGLMRAHLTAVEAAAAISGAAVEGAEVGSGWIAFTPGPIRGGAHAFSIGTAGSGTLVLQTILPALLVAPGPSSVTIEGGTHNPWAPTFDFLDRVYLPLVRRMGPAVTATLERHGFFPAGGGRFHVAVEPCGSLAGIDLLERGAVIARRVRALVSNLPAAIGEREVRRVIGRLSWDPDCGLTDTVVAHGPGNVVEVEIEATGLTERFTAFGRTGTSAERIADELVGEVRDYLALGAPVGCHLADQLLLPLGISAWLPAVGGRARGGAFRTGPLSRHATTHIDVLRQFLGVRIEVAPELDGRVCLVRVSPPL